MNARYSLDDRTIDKWLLRYGSDDAHSRWRAIRGTPQALRLAFTTIAVDEHALRRLTYEEAMLLVKDAEEILRQVRDTPRVMPWTEAATSVVRQRIAEWRKDPWSSSKDHSTNLMGAKAKGEREEEPIVKAAPMSADEMALQLFPQLRLSAARHLIDTTLRLGAKGLVELGAPMDKVFAVGSARAAACSERGVWNEPSFNEAARLQVLQVVQDWGTQTGANPLMVGGYQGRHGTPADRVKSLALDASTCADLAQRLPGGVSASGFQQWETAEEAHAYALFSVKDSKIDDMDFDMVVSLASAAARLAQKVIDDPRIALPALPDGLQAAAPGMVLACAKATCSNQMLPSRLEKPRDRQVAGNGKSELYGRVYRRPDEKTASARQAAIAPRPSASVRLTALATLMPRRFAANA